MGIIHHHAMIITGHGRHPRLADARQFAVSLGMLVSEIGESSINDYAHFAVFPDGSKEGWEESEVGDQHRSSLRQWMASQPEPWRLRWAEVSFGELGPTLAVDEWTSNEVDS